MKIDINEAERIVRLYRQKNWKIVQFWQKCGNALRDILYGGENELHPQVRYDKRGIRLPNGFYIQYPALRETAGGFMYISDARTYQKAIKDRVLTGSPPDDIAWTKVYGGKVTENIVQALAAIVIREQMAAVGQHHHVAFQVHDEIIITAPAATADAAEQKLIAVMSTPPKWAPDLPVACESGKAPTYGDT